MAAEKSGWGADQPSARHSHDLGPRPQERNDTGLRWWTDLSRSAQEFVAESPDLAGFSLINRFPRLVRSSLPPSHA